MGFQSFEEIEAWQNARTLSKWIGLVCKRSSAKKDRAWVDQITRSSLSIMSNIAEGNDAQTNNEFAKFLGYAKRSSAETRSQLYYGIDQGYISKEEMSKYGDLCKKVTSQLSNLIAYLRKHSSSLRQNQPIKKQRVTCNVKRAT